MVSDTFRCFAEDKCIFRILQAVQYLQSFFPYVRKYFLYCQAHQGIFISSNKLPFLVCISLSNFTMSTSYQGCNSAKPAKRLFFLSLYEGSQAPERFLSPVNPVLMIQHPLNASTKTYSIGMQEKYKKGVFFMVSFHRKLYHSAFIGKRCLFFLHLSSFQDL